MTIFTDSHHFSKPLDNLERQSLMTRLFSKEPFAAAFGKSREYNAEEHVPIESVVTTLNDWTVFLMTPTKLASVCFVAARNCMRQQALDGPKSVSRCGRSQSTTTCDSSYAPSSAQYYSILQSTTNTTPHYNLTK